VSTAKQIHDLYDQDAFKWYNENAKLLRERKFELIDIKNLAEEIESMGRGERDKLENYLSQLFLYLLKWKYQVSKRCVSWEISIKKRRRHAKRQLDENPSLKLIIAEIVNDAYEDSRYDAAQETELPLETFPESQPFTFEEALQEDWIYL